MLRLLVLCTHNSARSQMAEALLRHYCQELSLDAEVFSAGSEKTFVKPDAITVMNEVNLDITTQTSKTFDDLPDKWNFDVVFTVCDSAQESCPIYPVTTIRLHVSFPDPSGKSLDTWREVRNDLAKCSKKLIQLLKSGEIPSESVLKAEL